MKRESQASLHQPVELTTQTSTDYQFQNPGRARIRVASGDEVLTCDTSGTVWEWFCFGSKCSIDWNQVSMPTELKEIAKAFLFYRLESRATSTVRRDAKFIEFLSTTTVTERYPWSERDALAMFATLGKSDPVFAIIFRVFYLWCVRTGKQRFSRAIYFSLEETVVIRPSPYAELFLHQQYVTPTQELLILRHIENSYEPDERQALQRNVLLHLAFELAPRPSQIYALNKEDLALVSSALAEREEENVAFFTLWLPMSKKQSSGIPERRPRRVSGGLAEKIRELNLLDSEVFASPLTPMFASEKGSRLPAVRIGQLIREEMKSLSPRGGHATELRHHLGQALADQGAPVDVIAEALGHNSTVAARAYIAATPAIAQIKTRALGKNKTYQSLMKMMLTGDISERQNVSEERWIKGVVHTEYIHGVGGCDLPPKTSCPKNPVYSCYTCRDFHPFVDGPHEEVRSALETQAQLFIDVASVAMELDRSRIPLQLEQTLEAVDAVIQRCAENHHRRGA